MQSNFTAEFFISNRKNLQKKLNTDFPIIVPGSGLLQRNGDDTFPFNQDSNFWYLTGLDEPDLVLVLEKGREYLLVPFHDTVSTTFNGATDIEKLKSRSGITEILPFKSVYKQLVDTVKKHKTVYMPVAKPIYDERHESYAHPAIRLFTDRLRRQVSGLKIEDVRPALMSLRCIKQEPEINAIQSAINITIDAINYITRPEVLSEFKYEYQLEAALTLAFRSSGAAGHAFSPIVANGQDACTIHHIKNSGPIHPAQLTILDVGAEVEHYAADVSRTVILNEPTDRQKAIYQAVRDSQDYAFSLLKPGVLFIDYEQAVGKFVGQKLLELKITENTDTETIRHYFPHMTSHFVGLNVHDVGDYRKPFEAGMVLAVEPGIYVPEEGIGVRIEDNILITETGIKVLTEACPRSLE